ncbi:hypothetical protein CLAFUW4_05439 [Fulvia fulva]|uniref:Uncharacterized protein n=1 Tax=Passalora fulva TaxID=5499 RepID=A0A9Q8LIG1_PASFU|nr:uncharacterized protein CLAFUR5_05584 [Fulvia fulva]KAK4624048.1 hypothetical protein CLAFUR4_05433 [Fulvia fulva]KAK4625202.1 hypothetical protein CLAFUR0_05441 [Fulvia fulva]UJO17198.1 hypothetical protein CLAFUR5_05584 [Fulvia fulva]WPV15590.1 hypothetical protein CLAFUW4_05439 [Fulvia fulva]WPV29409.1 hypothetical protein CLAFUW7_05437 [Fulvia fulva]
MDVSATDDGVESSSDDYHLGAAEATVDGGQPCLDPDDDCEQHFGTPRDTPLEQTIPADAPQIPSDLEAQIDTQQHEKIAAKSGPIVPQPVLPCFSHNSKSDRAELEPAPGDEKAQRHVSHTHTNDTINDRHRLAVQEIRGQKHHAPPSDLAIELSRSKASAHLPPYEAEAGDNIVTER